MPILVKILPTAPVAYFLLCAEGLVNLVSFWEQRIFALLLLHPYSIIKRKEYWRLVTADFVHVDLVHFLLNMYLLYVFGTDLEELLTKTAKHGSSPFIVIYLTCLLTANILSTVSHRNEKSYTSAGASGTITGLLFALMTLDPHGHVLSYAVIGVIENIYLGPIFIVALAVYKWRRKNDRINHEVHFYGALAGVVSMSLLKTLML